MYHHEQSPGSQPPSASQPALALSRSTWLQTDLDPGSFTLILILILRVSLWSWSWQFHPDPEFQSNLDVLTMSSIQAQPLVVIQSFTTFSSLLSLVCLRPLLVSVLLLFSLFYLLSEVGHMLNQSKFSDCSDLNKSHSSSQTWTSAVVTCWKRFFNHSGSSAVCFLSTISSGFQLIASAHPSKVSHLRTHSGEKSQMPTAGELSAILSRSVSLWNNGGVYSREFGVNAVHNERNPVTNSYNNPRETLARSWWRWDFANNDEIDRIKSYWSD